MKPKFNARPYQLGQFLVRFVGAAAAGVLTAQAGNTWTGTTDQDWNTASNWGGAMPVAGTVLYINTATGNTPIITTAVVRTGADSWVGRGAAGRLDINSGGSISTSSKWFFIGDLTNGNGTVNVNAGGSITSDNHIRLGTSPATGALNVNGGSVAVATVTSGLGTITVDNGGTLSATNGDLTFPHSATPSTIAGASSVVSSSGQLFIGNGRTGTLAMSAGTMSSGSWTVIGINNSGNATFNLSGGTFNSSATNAAAFATIGANGNAVGVVNQTGGTWNQGGAGIQLAEGGTGSGTYNLGGGLLKTPRIYKGGGTSGIVNFNGGTLQPTATNDTNFLTGLTAANVRDGGAKINTNGFNITVGQALVHSSIGGDNASDGGLNKSGSGILALTGANTYTGATTVNGGTLQISGSGAVNSSSGITVTGDAKLVQTSTVASTAPITLTSGTLDGTTTVGNVTVADSASNVIKNGNGTAGGLLTTGNLTFNGAATLNLGINPTSTTAVVAAQALTTGAGNVTVNASALSWASGAYNLVSYTSLTGDATKFVKGSVTGLSNRQTATLSDTGSAIQLTIGGDNPTWTGANGNDWTTTTGNQNWYLAGNATSTDFLAGDIVTFDDSASTGAVNIAGASVSPLGTIFNNTSALPYTISSVDGYGIAAGTVALTGGGSVTLATANTYAGGTTVNAGTLNINHASAIGTGGLTLAAGVSIDNTSGAPIVLSTNNVQNWNDSTVNFLGSNDLSLGTGAVALTANATVSAGGNGTLGLGGVISGGYGLTKTGTGGLSLAGVNTYTGATAVNQGTLTVTGSINANNAAGAGQVRVGNMANSTGTLNLNGATVNTNASPFLVGSVADATGIVNMDGGALTTSGEVWISGDAGTHGTFNMSAGTLNSGSWFVVGRNGSDGNFNISGGALNVNNGSLTVGSFAGANGQVSITGGTVTTTYQTFAGEGGTGTISVSGTGSLVINGGEGLRVARNAGSTGTFNLGAGGTITTKMVASGGTSTFNFNGGTLKAGASSATFFQGLTTANVQGGGALIDSNGYAITIGQALTGSGDLTKTGSGTLTLTGADTYVGATTINAGTLVLSGTGSVNASSGINVNGGTFVQASSTAISSPVTLTSGTVDGVGSIGSVTVADGVGNVVSNGNGGSSALTIDSLTLNGAATLNAKVSDASSPGFVVNGLATNGSVTINASNSSWSNGVAYNLLSYASGSFSGIQLGTITGKSARQVASLVDTGSAITLSFAGDLPVWTGGVSGEWSTATIADPKNWTLQTNATAADYLESDTVLFNDSALGNTAITIAEAGVSPTSTSFDNSSKDYSLTSSGTVGIATGVLTKAGTGSLTLASANTYAGGTTLNGGVLNLNNAGATGSGALTINGGSLGNTSGADVTLTANAAQNWNGDFAYISNNSLNLGNGAVTLGGQGTSRAVNVTGGVLMAGEVNSSAMGLTKQGAGTLVFNTQGTTIAASHVGGALNVEAGTLQFNLTDANGGDLYTGDLYVADGLTGAGTVANGAGQERWVHLTTTTDSTFTGTLVNGPGGGGLGLMKLGAGTQTLTGNNTGTGRTTVNAGTLALTDGGSLTASDIFLANIGTGTATATLNVNGGTINASGQIRVSDGQNNTVAAQGTMNVGDGTVSSEGDLIVGFAGNSSTYGELNVGAGGTVNVGSTTNRWLIVNQWDSAQGRVNINGGTLNVNGGTDIMFSTGNGTGTSSITLNSGAINGGVDTVMDLNRAGGSGANNTVNLNGGTLTVASIIANTKTGTRVVNFNGGTLKAAGANANFLAADVASGAHVLAGGATLDDNGFAITVGQVLDGVGAVAKTGAGVTTLSGANTYTGATSVNAGTLQVTGSLAADSAVTVAQGATLGGTGTIAGSVNASGAIAPGVAGAGTLSTGEVTVAGSLAVEVNGAVADKVVSSGAVHLSGALSVTELAGGFTEASYVIAEGTSLTGTFSSVPEGYSVAYTETSATLTKQSAAGYDSWATAQGLDATNNGPTQDPDNDGISNVLEFVLGGNALASDTSILPVETLTETDFIFTFNRADDSESDVTLSFEAGSDLAAWPTTVAIGATSSNGVTVTENDANPDTVTVTIPRSNAVDGKLFGRLNATKQANP